MRRCCGLPYRDIRHWAIHPGGRSILDKVQARLELSDEQLVPARETLRNYGNMSSATVLFVIKHILDPRGRGGGRSGNRQETDDADGGERICSMAFGPGLTVETALFTKITAPRDAPPRRRRRRRRRRAAHASPRGILRPESALA